MCCRVLCWHWENRDGDHRALSTWRFIQYVVKEAKYIPSNVNNHAREPTLCPPGCPDGESRGRLEWWPGMVWKTSRRKWDLSWTCKVSLDKVNRRRRERCSQESDSMVAVGDHAGKK